VLLIKAVVSTAAVTATPIDQQRATEIRADLARQLTPRRPEMGDLQPYHARLNAAVDQLAAYLDTANAEVAAGWRDYLHWEDLIEQLAQPQLDTQVLSKVLLSFRRHRTGLEMEPFQQVQIALRNYVHEAEVLEAMGKDGQFDHCLRQLATSLARCEYDYSYEDAHKIGRELHCLERSIKGGTEALEAIRSQFQHPNAYGRMSLRLINRMLERDVRDETFISDTVDRRRTTGRAMTEAHLSAVLAANSQQATIDLVLEGKCRAPTTITEQGQVTIRGSFLTQVTARKRIQLNKDGISFQPAEARCSTSVRIHDIAADWRLVERIARRRAPRMKPDAESDVSQKTGRRIEREIDQQAETALQEANSVFVNFFCVPNRCYGTFPALMRFSTNLVDLKLHARAADPRQLGAPQPPPELNPDHDLGFAIHESMIGNYSEGLFGGKEITDKQWLRCLNTITGSEPRALWVHDRTERWSLTFADARPLVVRFQDDLFRVTVRIKQFDRQGQQFADLIDISGTFRAETTPDGPVLFREGDVSVQFVDGRQPDAGQQDLLDFIRWKFRSVMARELYFDGLVPPTGGSLGMLRNLQPKEYSFQDGWMRIGYQLLENLVEPS
jgi:hypothetical protein